jgi:hypothetical protein
MPSDLTAPINGVLSYFYWGENTELASIRASQADNSARASALSSATAESASGPTYASTAAGLAATTSGESFAVDDGDGTVTIYLHEAGAAIPQRTMATTDALAAQSGSTLVGTPRGVLADVLDGVVGAPIVGANFADDASSAEANAAALQTAVTNRDRRAIVAPGTVRLLTSTNVGQFRQQGIDYYTAVLINLNDVTFGSAVFHAKGRGVAGTYVEPMFATPRHTAAGTRRGLSFLGTQFDMSDDGNAVSTNQRATHITCTDDIRYIATVRYNSGARRGYGDHLDNCRAIVRVGQLHSKVTGGENYRYLTGLAWGGCLYKDFSEATDFDGVADTIGSLVYWNPGDPRLGQAIDFNSVKNAAIPPIAARGVRNIYTISYKYTTQPTYAEFLENAAPSSITISNDIVISACVGLNCGDAANPSIIIGTDNPTEPLEGPVTRLTLANHNLKDCGFVQVTGAKNLSLVNWTLTDTLVPDLSGWAAVTLLQDAVSSGNPLPIEATIINMDINGAPRGGLIASSSVRLDIDGLRIRNVNRSGSTDYAISIQTVPANGKHTIDRLDIEGDVRIGAAAGATILWGDRNKISGQLILQDNAHKAIAGKSHTLSLGDIPATGTIRRTAFIASRRCYIPRASFSVAAAVAQSGTNFRTLNFRRVRSGVVSTIASASNASAAWPASIRIDGGFAAIEPDAYLEPGDILYVDTASAGDGVTLSDLTVSFEEIGL